MKELREVIAENLHPLPQLPSRDELLAKADKIIAAIQREGYQFYEYNPRPR